MVNIFQMRSTRRAADTAVRSFNLQRRHTEDTDEARCVIGRAGIEIGSNFYQFNLSNTGKSTARNFHAHIEFSENRLPKLGKIKVFTTRDISEPELQNESDFPAESVILQGLGKKEWDDITHLNEALVISGTMEYDNGFDRPINKEFCLATVGDDRPNVPPSLNIPSCEALPDFLRRQTRKWREYGKVQN